MSHSLIDTLWVVLCATLVFNMQLGFLCLESGLTRSKNAINVALKNMADFALAVLLYWLFGFGLMFGASQTGWLGIGLFAPEVGGSHAWLSAFFLFQAMFCATAATILSGAAAERLRFGSYLLLGSLVAGLIYPVFGHWAWGGALVGHAMAGEIRGWLGADGFVDFAGATVVHSVGGWVALAVLLVIGPRQGRFEAGQPPRQMPASNLPLAMLGTLMLLFGWFGFNGGSTLALDERVPGIIVNTLLGGVAGIVAVLAISWRLKGYSDAIQPMNGLLAGLVSVTAGAHVISAVDAVVVGAIGGVVMLAAEALLLRWRIDDAVSAVPVHLAAGIWGTVAVALFGDAALLGNGLGTIGQLLIQLEGIVVCAIWSFGLTYLIVRTTHRRSPLRVDADAERAGLNVSEHGARTELVELLDAMARHARDGDVREEVPVEPFTEVGQIAAQYNKVIRALGQAVARTQAILHDIRDGIITFTRDGALTSLNPGAQRLFGLPAETTGIALPALLSDGDWQPQLLPAPGGHIKREVACRRCDGTAFLAELTISRDDAAEREIYTGTLRDITERRRIEDQLVHEKTLAQITLAAIGDGVITTDSLGIVTYLNPVAQQLTGYQAADAVGCPVSEIYRVVEEGSGAVLPNPLLQVLRVPYGRPRPAPDQHRMLQRRDGKVFPVQEAAAPIRNAEEELVGAVLTFRDVTATQQLARELSYQAAHDALTGLINRSEFERRLERLLQARDGQRSGVLCYLDLDQFKVVNDTCGHVAGDELLRQLAALFRTRVRGSDVLARLGGDEFGVLLYECSMAQALPVAESIRQLTEEFRFSWEQRTFAVGVSIGLVAIDEATAGLGEVLRAADAACYAAKDTGRNRLHVYQADDHRLLEREGEMLWANRIRQALDEDRLRLYVQPIVPINADGPRPRYEVLIRMLDHKGMVIPPGAFMPAAERYNVATAIDRWVVTNTLAWIGDYVRRRGRVPGHYSINLSADSLSEREFLGFVLDRIKHNRVPPECICFEVTETSAIANLSSAITFMEQLKAIGCAFALDDFGSGVSSFGYLKNLPVDYIKIDGVFVKDICRDPIARAMVASIHNIGQEMGLRTVAEFVESEQILEELRVIGISYAQGFHLGEPVPLDQMSEVRMMPR